MIMLEKYKESTSKSKELWARAIRLFPGGVSHNIRTFGMPTSGAYPPFIKRAEGAHLWDVDGNKYVDWWITHYSLILGHNNPKVRAAIENQLQFGHHFGAMNEPQVNYGEKLQEAVPLLSQMRFTATGSEATMYAVRMARMFTGKSLVGKALGGWHGGNDALTYHINHPYSDAPFYNGVSFDFNNRESLDSMLKIHGKDLAAVIVEPVVGAGGGIPPESGFLEYLREETEARGILLIFDEIITGFRLRFGSAGDGIFGVEPDLLTLGKSAAGGMPLGVYGGREDIMAFAAPGAEGGKWVGGGTFSSHPITMAAGIATLDELKLRRDDYSSLNKLGDDFRNRINKLLEDKDAKVFGTGYGSMMFIISLKDNLNNAHPTPGEIGEKFDQDLHDKLQGLLMEQGVFGYHGLGALSFAHEKKDLDKTLDAIAIAIDSL
jgi:glutamate-1-semialdehyde 2,1-aminomutase